MYTPHPSLVPIEMASAGMLTVTNSFENKTPEAMAAISSNLITAEPGIDALAAGLAEAAGGRRRLRAPRAGQRRALEPRLGRLVRRRADGARRGAAERCSGAAAQRRGSRSALAGLAPPPGNPRFALFDSLRAIAALRILVFHVAGVTGRWRPAGPGDAARRAGPARR